MLFQFVNVLLQVLVHKSHDLLQEEIGIAIYNMASVDFDGFFAAFLPEFLTSCDGVDANQKNVLGRNFKMDRVRRERGQAKGRTGQGSHAWGLPREEGAVVCTRRWLLNDLVLRLDAGAHASPGVCSSRQPLGPGPSSPSACLRFFVLLPRDPDTVPSRVVNSQTGCEDWCSGVSESPEFEMGPWALPRPPSSVWADLLPGPRRSPRSTPPCPPCCPLRERGGRVGSVAPRAAPWVAVGAHGASAARVSGSRVRVPWHPASVPAPPSWALTCPASSVSR